MARRLFGQAGNTFARGQDLHDIAQRDIARGQHDQQMIKQISRFGGQCRVILLQGGDVAYEDDLMMITDSEGKDWDFSMMDGEEAEAANWTVAIQKNIDFSGK